MLQDIFDALKGVLTVFSKRKPLTHTDTGTGTSFKTFYPRAPFKLLEIRFLTTALAAGETLTFTRTSGTPLKSPMLTYINYVMFTMDLGTSGITSLSISFDSDEGLFTETDTIVPTLSANTGGDRWGLEIVYELL